MIFSTNAAIEWFLGKEILMVLQDKKIEKHYSYEKQWIYNNKKKKMIMINKTM